MKGKIVFKGGPGSGNFGHAGRPGKRGGSAPKSGIGAAMSLRTGRTAAEKAGWKATPRTASMQKRLASESITITHTYTEGYNTILAEGVTMGKELGKLSDGTVVMLKPASVGAARPTAAKSEVATYETAKLLGWDDLVTPSAERPDGRSIQVIQDGHTYSQHLADTKTVLEHWKASDYNNISSEFRHDANRILLLDAISGNADRHNKNVLVVQRGGKPRLMAIDNDGSFEVDWFKTTADQRVRRTRMTFMQYNTATFTKSELEPIVRLSQNDDYKSYLVGNFGNTVANNTMARVAEIASWYEGAE